MKNIFLLLCVWIFALACTPKTNEENKASLQNKFSKEIFLHIADLQDRRDSDSLVQFFSHENPEYRQAAALAFGSIQDSGAISSLNRLLNDVDTHVRIAAIYALGQTGTDSAQYSLLRSLPVEEVTAVRKEVLIALGKCITEENYDALVNFQPKDSLEMEGLLWGLYRATIRETITPKAIRIAAGFLHDGYSFQTRLGAAHLLARTKDADISMYLDEIIGSALHDKSAFVRMASAAALRHSQKDKVVNALTGKIIKDSDYRVRINAIRAMKGMDSVRIKPTLIHSLSEQTTQVAVAAAQILAPILSKEEGKSIEEHLVANLHWRVRAILLGGMLGANNIHRPLIDKVKAMYQSTANLYEKAALLTALGNSPLTYEYVVTETFKTSDKVISTAGIGALATMRGLEDFPNAVKSAYADMLKEAFLSGDLAMIGMASNIFMASDFGYKEVYDSIPFLYEAKRQLTLPKDNEGMQSLQAAIDFFEENETPIAISNAYNHPVDWELVKTIGSHQKMEIVTSKGVIEIELMVDDAPGSVANFVQLAKDKYFDGKNFHRVVPNFVVQGGCNRGDGWGAENYSIRSEFAPLPYKEGYIGMASAGKDTEGTQWFITHSPTPHLDGRYTVFARVTNGMEIVHQLEMGDEIKSVFFQNAGE